MKTANYILSFLLIWYCISRGDIFGIGLVMAGFLVMMNLIED